MDDYLLCELALRVLDPKTRQAFELANVGTTFPKFEKLKEFVQDHYHVLRLADCSGPKVNTTKPAQQVKAPQSPNKFAPRAQALLTHSSKQEGGKTYPSGRMYHSHALSVNNHMLLPHVHSILPWIHHIVLQP